MGLGHDVWNRFSTNQRFGAPLTKNMETKFALGCTARSLDLVPPFPQSSYSFLLVPPSSCFLLLLPSPSASFLTLPHPSSSFLLLPPRSTFLLLLLLPYPSSFLFLIVLVSSPARASSMPSCVLCYSKLACFRGYSSLQNLWGSPCSPAPRACRLLQLAGHKQYVPECNRTCQNACKTNQMSLNICQTECQTRCHIMRLRKEAL